MNKNQLIHLQVVIIERAKNFGNKIIEPYAKIAERKNQTRLYRRLKNSLCNALRFSGPQRA